VNIVLIEPEIPPNTGNVARLCAATNSTLHLVGPLGFRLDDRELKRAGMDYWEQVTWKYWDSFAALQAAISSGSALLGATGRGQKPAPTTTTTAEPRFHFVETGAARLYSEVQYRMDDYLVFGRETKGLPATLREAHRESLVSIPMWNPQARSLNLSNCVAIVLYEALRQTAAA
jgi:tRNA (cytidine/uridine-2'-O-)-methyltransferase